jgi:hypothetical protein
MRSKEVLCELRPRDCRLQFIWSALAALCLATGLVYELVHLGLWHGVVKLN